MKKYFVNTGHSLTYDKKFITAGIELKADVLKHMGEDRIQKLVEGKVLVTKNIALDKDDESVLPKSDQKVNLIKKSKAEKEAAKKEKAEKAKKEKLEKAKADEKDSAKE